MKRILITMLIAISIGFMASFGMAFRDLYKVPDAATSERTTAEVDAIEERFNSLGLKYNPEVVSYKEVLENGQEGHIIKAWDLKRNHEANAILGILFTGVALTFGALGFLVVFQIGAALWRQRQTIKDHVYEIIGDLKDWWADLRAKA